MRKNHLTSLQAQPKEFFHLIPQTGVTHLFCTQDPKHNAVWDMAISPEGRVFFSACGESYLALDARLYEYDHKNRRMIRHMALEEKVMTSRSALRTSKLHTAMSFIGNGWILTTTHTTSPGPNQPTWMPYNYADHPYEGYPGSNLILHNYNTGETVGKGMISPHDTTYGGTYDPKNGDYFCITWMRGVGYVYNIHTGEWRCLGQISDSHTSRTFLLSDGHIYGSTFSGAIFRYNTDKREVEFLGVSAPGLIRHAVELDGVLYFTTGPCGVAGRGQELYSFNLKTREIATIGRPVPQVKPLNEKENAYCNAYGLALDSQNRLWYGCMTYVERCGRYMGAKLYMWDFLNGKEPVDCGFLGTTKRTISITAEMYIRDDVLYISDGNHTSHEDTPCGIMAIDLKEFVPALETEKRIFSHDYVNYLPYQAEAAEWYPKDDWDECLEKYENYLEKTKRYFDRFNVENAFRYPFAHACGVSIWEKVGFGKTTVRHIAWKNNQEFSFWCEGTPVHRTDCLVDEKGDVHVKNICEDETPVYTELKAGNAEGTLPAVPGRQYLAKAEATVALHDGSVLAGTKDTMLAKVKNGKVFSLGQVCAAGGIHALDVAPDGKAYGVAGHAEGVGQLFTYDDENGLKLLGLLPEAFAENGRNVAIYRPTTLALSPDGKYLAVGGADEIGGLVVLKL